jgi:hypothetical protein
LLREKNADEDTGLAHCSTDRPDTLLSAYQELRARFLNRQQGQKRVLDSPREAANAELCRANQT